MQWVEILEYSAIEYYELVACVADDFSCCVPQNCNNHNASRLLA